MKLLRYVRFGLINALLSYGFSMQAQETSSPTSFLSVQAGPSWYVGQQLGITNRSDAFRQDLRRGVAWDVSYWYTGQRPTGKGFKAGPGVLYQGSLYKASHEDGADKIAMHYIALQAGMFYFQKHYMLQLAGGVGYQLYNDKSIVYGKSRDVSMNKLACHLSCGGEYFLTQCWGLSARLNWLISSSDSYSVDYNGQHWQVDNPKTGGGYFGQLSLLFGLNFHF